MSDLLFIVVAVSGLSPVIISVRRQLLHEVWGPGYQEGNLRVYMAQLRRKLEPDHHRPRFLLNEPGMGYRFAPGDS